MVKILIKHSLSTKTKKLSSTTLLTPAAIHELLRKLEKSRRVEKRMFVKIQNGLRCLYKDIAFFVMNFINNHASLDNIVITREFTRLNCELTSFINTLQWREQARGPTSMSSAKVDGLEDFEMWKHHVIWLLYTPPTERTILTSGKTLNYDNGEYLTWGLPSPTAFNRKIFKRYRPVFVVEKIKGGRHVQHRVKNLYMCLSKAKKQDEKLYLVTWSHFMEQVLVGEKVCPPQWCKRNTVD